MLYHVTRWNLRMVGEALPQLLTDTVSTVVLVVEEVEGVAGMVVVEQEVSQDAQNIEVSIQRIALTQLNCAITKLIIGF